MAKGLAHLHAHRVVHCDVKPDSILTDGVAGSAGDNDNVVLVVSDMGECVGMTMHCDHGYTTLTTYQRGGAPAYWAPEVAGATREYAAPSTTTSRHVCA